MGVERGAPHTGACRFAPKTSRKAPAQTQRRRAADIFNPQMGRRKRPWNRNRARGAATASRADGGFGGNGEPERLRDL